MSPNTTPNLPSTPPSATHPLVEAPTYTLGDRVEVTPAYAPLGCPDEVSRLVDLAGTVVNPKNRAGYVCVKLDSGIRNPENQNWWHFLPTELKKVTDDTATSLHNPVKI